MIPIMTESTIRGGMPCLVDGYVLAGAPPLNAPGEAVAVLCPGWDPEAEVTQVYWPRKNREKLRPMPRAMWQQETDLLELALIEEAGGE